MINHTAQFLSSPLDGTLSNKAYVELLARQTFGAELTVE